jgi:hypothetical protein
MVLPLGRTQLRQLSLQLVASTHRHLQPVSLHKLRGKRSTAARHLLLVSLLYTPLVHAAPQCTLRATCLKTRQGSSSRRTAVHSSCSQQQGSPTVLHTVHAAMCASVTTQSQRPLHQAPVPRKQLQPQQLQPLGRTHQSSHPARLQQKTVLHAKAQQPAAAQLSRRLPAAQLSPRLRSHVLHQSQARRPRLLTVRLSSLQ